jgi:3-methyladenine DNA glycosylase AlkD
LRTTQAKEVSRLEGEITARFAALPRNDTETVRNLRREFSRRLAKTPPALVLALATKLAGAQIVPRFFAYEMVQHHRQTFQRLNTKSLEELGQNIDNWGAVDTFACYLAGPAWRERHVSDPLIRRWARSRNRWWRRAALVSTVALNNKARGGSGDTARTLMICAMLITDRDEMVVKALSWALRELSKRDRESVRKFLQKHQEVLSPRVVREVNNKLQTGLKNPRKQRTYGAT